MLPSTTDDAIFNNLQPKELLRYSQTSRTANDAVSSYIRRAFKLERVLGRYFSQSEILELRRIQYSTGALISGSTALQFFDRSYYPESDLDIYVQFDSRQDIALWLEEKGYTMQPYAKNPTAGLRKVLEEMTVTIPLMGTLVYPGTFIVLEFLKDRGGEMSKIQLLIAECPMASILKFHSTCVMNIITYDKAYSLYPKGTFVTRQSLVTQLPSSPLSRFIEYQRAFKKYETRGWDVITCTPDVMRKSPFGGELRRVGDSDCWTIPILPKLDLPLSTLEANSWTLHLRRGRHAEHGFSIIATPLSRWRFSYTVAERLLPYLHNKVNSNTDQNVEDRLPTLVEQCVALHQYQFELLEVFGSMESG